MDERSLLMTWSAGKNLRRGIVFLGLLACSLAAGAVKIGDPTPAFNLHTLDGKTISIESLKGKVVLLDFWATWCGPCRKALPELKELQRKNTGKPLVVISVSADEDHEALEQFVHANGMSWTQAWDAQGRVAGGIFGISSLPSYVLIDAQGRIAYLMKGWAPYSSQAQLGQAVSRSLDTTACTPSADKTC
jgi:thiol-disulfide isomerase/thioredoxin